MILNGCRRCASPRQCRQGQLVLRAALMITLATAAGWEMRDRCDARVSVMWACARLAMNSSSAGGMAWAMAPLKAQGGVVVPVGASGGAAPALRASGRWAAAR